jgi:hypothetical protein
VHEHEERPRARPLQRALARARLEIARQVGAPRLQHWGESGQQANDNRGAEREEHGARIAKSRGGLALVEQKDTERGTSPVRYQDSHHSTDKRQEHALRE